MAASPPPKKILYCHCAYADVVPREVKQQVLATLAGSGQPFDAVADLCEMSATRDPSLRGLAGQANLTIAACYPRAVRWLFAAADAPLSADARLLNMRTQPAEEVAAELLGSGGAAGKDQP